MVEKKRDRKEYFKQYRLKNLTNLEKTVDHINQDKLSLIYDKMYQISKKYILIAEYYSRQPQEIVYRGYTNKLYKRDFCGEIMDKYSDLKLIDYGFVYHRDSNFPLDDITWFLLEKS